MATVVETWLDAKMSPATDAAIDSGLANCVKMMQTLRMKSRGNMNRCVTLTQAASVAADVRMYPHGVRVVHGGTQANEYPATTGVVSLGWYTRTDHVMVARVFAGFMPIKKATTEPAQIVLDGNGRYGTTFVNPDLREMVEYIDLMTPPLDAVREAVRVNPADLDAWVAYAKQLDAEGYEKYAGKIRKRIIGIN